MACCLIISLFFIFILERVKPQNANPRVHSVQAGLRLDENRNSRIEINGKIGLRDIRWRRDHVTRMRATTHLLYLLARS